MNEGVVKADKGILFVRVRINGEPGLLKLSSAFSTCNGVLQINVAAINGVQ